MHLAIDHREQPAGLVELLQAHFEIEMTTLTAGDYLVNNRITVERKSGRDFLVSIIDLRLFRQVANLKKNCTHSILLIEGDPFRTDLRFDYRAIRGALLSVMAIWQVPVIFADSREDSCEILAMIGRQDETGADVVPLRGGYRPKRLRSRQLYLLQGLPDVGPKLALRLLAHFGSVRRVMAATEEELMAVNGVGQVTARKIREILDKE